MRWEQIFHERNIDSPRLSAQVLLAFTLGLQRLEMLLDPLTSVDAHSREVFTCLASRRAEGFPVAYLVGVKEFYGLPFLVTPDVLIPRPETELFIDYLVATHGSDDQRMVLDIGTGSGALAVTCAHVFPLFHVVAGDISFKAIAVAQRNATSLGVSDRVTLFQGDLVESVRVENVDIILANLPYVPESTRDSLSPEVVDYEPSVALFGGIDGFNFYRRLAASLQGRVKSGTVLLCEIDCSQGELFQQLFVSVSRSVVVRKDLAGKDRLGVVVF